VSRILELSIANVNLSIESDINLKGLSYKRYDPFKTDKRMPDVNFKFQVIESIKGARQKRDQYLECNPSSSTVFDFKRNNLSIRYLQEFKTELERFRIGPYLLAPFFVSFGAAMIHSSAILRKGKAIVFLSPDEGGKTTAVKLANEGQILCDDQNVIKKTISGYNVYGTPWGMIANNIEGPLGAIFLIEKAGCFNISPLSTNTLLGYLWNEHLPYHFFLPPKYSQRHFGFLYRLSRSIPAYTMQFPRNSIDWDAIDRIMRPS
jgi:hypothetical protein